MSEQVVKEVSEKDAMTKKVYDSYKAYKDNIQGYHSLTEQAFLNARNAK
ncbi:MAG: TRAP-type mannitol/chloroaromatic compound transport system substrate-binding protein [Bermanella sp.]